MARSQRNFVARLELLNSFESLDAASGVLIGAVAGAIDCFFASVGGVEQSVAASEGEARNSNSSINLDALPPSFAEILEVAEAGLFGCNKENVIPVIGPEVSDTPRRCAFSKAADSRFPGSRDDLFQRWIARHGVGQFA